MALIKSVEVRVKITSWYIISVLAAELCATLLWGTWKRALWWAGLRGSCSVAREQTRCISDSTRARVLPALPALPARRVEELTSQQPVLIAAGARVQPEYRQS